MRNKTIYLAIALSLVTSVVSAAPWTYRGTLNDGGAPANGSYDIRVSLLSESRNASITSPITFYEVPVENGQFAVDVDFGMDLAAAPAMRLQTEVQQANSGFMALGEPTRFDPKAALGSMCWDTAGNAGTNPATDFLGTTDAQPFVLRTRNVQSLRIEPSSELDGGDPITANVIVGSSRNEVVNGARGATISGGGSDSGDPDYPVTRAQHIVSDHYVTIGGGYANQAGNRDSDPINSAFATVSGGYGNSAIGESSFVGGGNSNRALGKSSVVGGGNANGANADTSVVGGGQSNFAHGIHTAIGGGAGNQTFGEYSSVSGGRTNCAGGDYSWAGGRLAKIRPGDGADSSVCAGDPRSGDANGDEGSFLWGGSRAASFRTTGPNQFGVRAAAIFFGTALVTEVDVPAGRFINTTSGAHLTTGGTWTNASSRTLKTAFEAIDPMAVLGKVATLPLSTWSYKESVEGRHLGPMAEDFKQAFDLGGDGKSISTVDADGIALAAIQGLNQKLDSENAALKSALAAVEARLRAIEGGR